MDVPENKLREYTRRLLLARMELLVKNGFYGLLLMHVGFALTDSIENAGAGGDKSGEKIFFNPDFLEKISDRELLYVLEHEIMHLALRHCERGETVQETERFNIACDIVVNSNILKSHKMDESSITIGANGGIQRHLAPDGREGYEFTAEELYALLPIPDSEQVKGPGSKAQGSSASKKKSDNDGDGNSDGPGSEKGLEKKTAGSASSGTGWDDHNTMNAETEPDNTMREVWTQRIANAAASMETREGLDGRGTVPAFAERLLENLRSPQTDWRTILNDFVQEEICDYSFSPPDRRFDDSPFFLPDFNEKEDTVKDILFMIDTSGSMSDKAISAAFSEIKGAIDQFGGKLKGWLGFFDAAITEPSPFESMEEFRIIRPYGGGGTDFQIIFEYVAQHMENNLPASIIILTDGYAPFPQEHLAMSIPVLWLLNNEAVKPPWGKVARIKL
ncbi:MAG: hypothetical protein IJL87_07905 [Clostridia bacterium]|nr:hypothetical protein [Clostridia bacterium]